MTMHSLKSSLQFHVLLSLTIFTVRDLISKKYSVNFTQIHRLVITTDGTVYIRLQLFHDPNGTSI